MSDVMVLARNPSEMATARDRLIEFFSGQLNALHGRSNVVESQVEIARQNGWATKPFTRQLNGIQRRARFYDKLRRALEAGYNVVPNWQMQTFAVRAAGESPRFKVSTQRSGTPILETDIRMLAAGEGRYVSETLVTEDYDELVDRKNWKGEPEQVREYTAVAEEYTKVAYPLDVAHPMLMSEVSEAMALRVFDEIGVSRDNYTRRGSLANGDPFILGRVRNPMRGRADVTFFIGWTFNPTRL